MRLAALNKTQRAAYDAAVEGTHHREVELEVYRRRDGKPVLSLTNQFLGGQVQGDLARSPVTVLECELLDDDFALDWANGEHRKYEVRVIDSRFVPELDDWVEEPVFRGPLWDFERTGPVVSLVAEGPEKNAQGSIRRAEWWPARTRATKVIRELLTAAGAEGRDLRIPNLKRRLPRQVTVGVRLGKRDKDTKKDRRPKVQRLLVNREDTYWSVAEEVADSLDRDFFGDNRGRFVVAAKRSRPTIRLTRRTIVSPVTEKRATDGELTNVWIVNGPNPKGPRSRPHARVELPKRHPASAWSLRWNGARREVIEAVENKHVKTNAQAARIARRKRDQALRELVTYEIEALPIVPWVRPGSMVSAPTDAGRATGRIPSWTLPLGPGPDPLVLGAARRRMWRR